MTQANKELDAQWEEWKKEHERVYSGPEEEATRRAIWEKNLQMVEAHNKKADQGKKSWWMGMNNFSDMTPEELKKMCCGLVPPDSNSMAMDDSEDDSE